MSLTLQTTDSFDLQVGSLEKIALVGSGFSSGQFWRMENPVLDERRILKKGGLWPYQRKLWHSDAFVKALVAGYGAGKSYLLCKRAISSALQNAPAMVAIVSPTFKMARRTVMRTLTELLEGKRRQFGNDFWYRHNKSTAEFIIKFRGRVGTILILSGEDPIQLKGPNLAAAYLDEPFVMVEDVFTQMIARVRHPDAISSEIGLFGTPEQLGWGYTLCKTAALDSVKDLIDEPLTVQMINAGTGQNLTLDPSYVKRLAARLSPLARQAYIDGLFINLTEGRVFYGFDDNQHIKEKQRPKHAELGCGIDFNVTPMSAVVFWKDRENIHIFKEYQLPNSDTEELAGELRKTFPDLTEVYPDPSGDERSTRAPGGRTDFYYLEQKGFHVNTVEGYYNIKDGYNIVNGKFKPSDSSEPSITIDPSCEKLIEFLNGYSHPMMNKQKHMKHLLDAFRYPMTYLFPLPTDWAGEARLYGV